MEVQTRSDSNGKYSGLHFFDTVNASYNAWQEDKNIWKLSWEDAGGHHRFRPKLKGDDWNPKSEEKLNELSTLYKFALPDELFWIDQLLLPDNYDELFKLKAELSKEEYDNLYMVNCIKTVLSDQEFRLKYNCKVQQLKIVLQLLADRFRLGEEIEVIRAARFGIRPRHIEAAEGIGADHRAGALTIDV